MTGFTTTSASGWPHHSRTWSAVTTCRWFSTRARCSASVPWPVMASADRCTNSTTRRGRTVVEPAVVEPPLVEPVETTPEPPSSGPAPARSNASWFRASCPAAFDRRTSSGSVDPSRARRSAPWLIAASRSRASARSSSPSTRLVPLKETWRCWTSKCRPSAARSAFSRAWSGMNRAIASAMSRSRAAKPILCANGATWASTQVAASIDRCPVAWATRRARQACRSPAITRVQVLGRRYFSSTASATRFRPASLEMPSARASSARQNSATSGAPGPASGRPVSPTPGVSQVAASSMDSGGCCSAQVTAASSTSASARSAAARRSRAKASTSRGESRSPSAVVLVVVLMSELKH